MNPIDPVIEDVSASTNNYIANNSKTYLIWGGLLTLVMISACLYLGLNLFVAIMPITAIGIVSYVRIHKRIKSQFIKQFGDSIGFSYSESAGTGTISGKLFKIGHDPKISDVLSGIH